MKILLVNPKSPVFSTRIGVGIQIPLGLLAIGGPLLDAGHQVSLLDMDALGLSLEQTCREILARKPQAVLIGHSGSTTAHPSSMILARKIKECSPTLAIIYGGVFPTYHAKEILQNEPAVDIIVRGEGEETTLRTIHALENGFPLSHILGITYRSHEGVLENVSAPLLKNLDDYRIGWELIESWDLYQCWGVGRAAAIQFSRGCPHQCSYCGQNRFWQRWRRRDPVKVVDEMEMLFRKHDVRFINITDENPAVSRQAWQTLLEELQRRNLPIALFAGMRASEVIRDADILPLYRKVGFVCINMGIETTDQDTIRLIRKGSNASDDFQAIQLLKKNNILSMAGYVIGFKRGKTPGLLTTLTTLAAYGPDFLNTLYATPHSWTPFAKENSQRQVIQTDLGRWDYRTQVLDMDGISPWQIFIWVKMLEMLYHLRPMNLLRILFHPDLLCRHGLRWSVQRMTRVWFAEIWDFLWHLKINRHSLSLKIFLDRITVVQPSDHPHAHEKSQFPQAWQKVSFIAK
ncbi:MAG: radical SAM protein [Magnetococcales bacterium]|nr:cobalamin-dependent protein [Magnetococcales bacterium]NGZ25562.1 radical SAM protein [Magnetococcales bacterium]